MGRLGLHPRRAVAMTTRPLQRSFAVLLIIVLVGAVSFAAFVSRRDGRACAGAPRSTRRASINATVVRPADAGPLKCCCHRDVLASRWERGPCQTRARGAQAAWHDVRLPTSDALVYIMLLWHAVGLDFGS